MQGMYDLCIKLLDMCDNPNPVSYEWRQEKHKVFIDLDTAFFDRYSDGHHIDFETDQRALIEWCINAHVGTINTIMGCPVTYWHAVSALRYWTERLGVLFYGRHS